MSSWAGQCRYWVEQARAYIDSSGWYRVERARANVEPRGPESMSSRPGPMSSRASTGRCRAEWAQADVELSGPGLMSSWTGRAYVKLSRLGPTSSWAGLGCRVVRVLVDVEPSEPELMSSQANPSRCRAELVRVQVEWLRSNSSQVSCFHIKWI